jgi:beta-N-acetylhexosaminidase
VRAGLALKRDVGQLLWLGFEGTSLPRRMKAQIAGGEVGVVVVFARNLERAVVRGPVPQEVVDVRALAALDRAIHAAAGDQPVLVAIDHEGGAVQRIRAPATQWPPMLSLDGHAAPDDETLAAAVGRAMGRELAALGFDLDFAPVLDVHTNDANPIIGERAFGRDADAASRRALSLASGLAASGIIACGKHFPGHGDTAVDSHEALPRLDHPRARLDAVELLPFRRAAAAGLPLIMTGHLLCTAIDAASPATLSPAVLSVLRKDLGYRGLIVSDDLVMKAIVAHGGVGDAAVRAIRAGCDAVLISRDRAKQDEARAALLRAARRDRTLRARIAESAARIRALKSAHLAARAAAPPPGLDVVGAAAHRELADRMAGNAHW